MYIFSSFIIIITIHFGKNPMKGGIPPRDRKFIENRSFAVLFLFMLLIIWFIVRVFVMFRTVIIFKVVNV